MDKLEPVLKQKFWILLGVGIIMTFVGWWMATGSLAATITQRKTALDGVEKNIPTSEVPNDSWSQALAQINANQSRLVDVAKRELWVRQKDQMFWPPTVDDFAAKIPYRGEYPPVATVLYGQNYDIDAKRVWKRSNPFDPVDQTGTVMFPYSRFPHKNYRDLTPTSPEIWDEQEDLWILVPIMDAINNMNGGDEATRQDAVIHVVEKLALMGGDRDKLNAGPSTGGGSAQEGTMGMMMTMGGSSMGGTASDGGSDMMGGVGARSAGGLTLPATADFDPAEVYGDGGGGAAAGGGMGGYAASSMPMDAGSSGGAMGGTMGSMGGTGTTSTVRRYVDDNEALPYKTRAFYLSVIMDHRKVPAFLGELTANGNSVWPIEIGRVQVVRLTPDEGMGQGTGGGSLAGMGASPMYGGSSSPYGGSSGSYGGFGGSASFAPMPEIGSNAASSEPFGGGVAGADSGFGGVGPDGAGMPNSAAVAGRGAYASFDVALTDPFMAKVALCGLIYIYKEVKEPEAPPPTEPAPVTTEPLADSTMPAEPQATPEPSDTPAPAESNVPQPANTEPSATAPAPAANDSPAASSPPASPAPPQ